MTYERNRLVVLLLFLLAGCGGEPPATLDSAAGQQLPDAVRAASETIEARGILESVTYLGGDEVEGRGPGTRGERLTREYLARRMERLGLEPAFGGTGWDQAFEIVGVTSIMPERWEFEGTRGTASFRFRD